MATRAKRRWPGCPTRWRARAHGIATNLDYLRQIVADARFAAGELSTRFLETFEYRPAAIEVLEAGTPRAGLSGSGRLLGYRRAAVRSDGRLRVPAGQPHRRQRAGRRRHRGHAGRPHAALSWRRRHRADRRAMRGHAGRRARADVAAGGGARGQVLATGRALSSCRMYLAVRDGLECRLRCAWATCCRACVPSCRARPPRQAEPQAAPPELVPAYGDTWRIGVLYGPHDGLDVPVYWAAARPSRWDSLAACRAHAARGRHAPRVSRAAGRAAAPEAEPQAAPPELVRRPMAIPGASAFLRAAWRAGLSSRRPSTPLRRRLGSPLQLQSPGRAPDRPLPDWARERAARPGCIRPTSTTANTPSAASTSPATAP